MTKRKLMEKGKVLNVYGMIVFSIIKALKFVISVCIRMCNRIIVIVDIFEDKRK